MSNVTVWECPNCGSTDFVDVGLNKQQCEYCGTILTLDEVAPKLVKCPRCGFDNERGDRYCNNCGGVLGRWTPIESKKLDLATFSIIATFFGSFVVPFGGPILGLILGYKALDGSPAPALQAGAAVKPTEVVVLPRSPEKEIPNRDSSNH